MTARRSKANGWSKPLRTLSQRTCEWRMTESSPLEPSTLDRPRAARQGGARVWILRHNIAGVRTASAPSKFALASKSSYTSNISSRNLSR